MKKISIISVVCLLIVLPSFVGAQNIVDKLLEEFKIKRWEMLFKGPSAEIVHNENGFLGEIYFFEIRKVDGEEEWPIYGILAYKGFQKEIQPVILSESAFLKTEPFRSLGRAKEKLKEILKENPH